MNPMLLLAFACVFTAGGIAGRYLLPLRRTYAGYAARLRLGRQQDPPAILIQIAAPRASFTAMISRDVALSASAQMQRLAQELPQ